MVHPCNLASVSFDVGLATGPRPSALWPLFFHFSFTTPGARKECARLGLHGVICLDARASLLKTAKVREQRERERERERERGESRARDGTVTEYAGTTPWARACRLPAQRLPVALQQGTGEPTWLTPDPLSKGPVGVALASPACPWARALALGPHALVRHFSKAHGKPFG